ncbi:MAG TPA: aldolase [Leptospiraceae bacterium]|nr:aldolase [Leptospiraceae bacterium]
MNRSQVVIMDAKQKDSESRLRSALHQLKEMHGLVAIKTGTEVEDMSFSEISMLRRITDGLLPLHVKVGGPEARNDIRNLLQIGVDGIIAPMIESSYALKNFIQTLKELCSPEQYEKLEKGINLETVTAFQNMDSILTSPARMELKQITAARTDLSGSMERSPDDPEVLEACALIVARCQEYELRTSVGGAIHPGIIEILVNRIAPDTINTRHMVISRSALRQDATGHLTRCLEFELELYRYLSTIPGIRQEAYSNRVKLLSARMKKALRT